MTWAEIITIEPYLETMRKDAAAIDGSDEHFCANERWYGDFKPRVCALVGWDAADGRLAFDQAYDVAYQTIYDALPPCKNCGCM